MIYTTKILFLEFTLFFLSTSQCFLPNIHVLDCGRKPANVQTLLSLTIAPPFFPSNAEWIILNVPFFFGGGCVASIS